MKKINLKKIYQVEDKVFESRADAQKYLKEVNSKEKVEKALKEFHNTVGTEMAFMVMNGIGIDGLKTAIKAYEKATRLTPPRKKPSKEKPKKLVTN